MVVKGPGGDPLVCQAQRSGFIQFDFRVYVQYILYITPGIKNIPVEFFRPITSVPLAIKRTSMKTFKSFWSQLRNNMQREKSCL